MDSSKLLEALREETLPRLKPTRAALDQARALGAVEKLEAVRELLHKVAGTAAVAGLPQLSRLARIGEEVALLALEGDAKPSRRLFEALDSVLSAIEQDLDPAPVTAKMLPAHEPSPGEGGRGRVVVASDEVVSAKLLVRLLEEQGFSPRKVSLSGAADALPDCELLLLDVPASGGASAAVEDALVNGNKRHVPVLVIAKSDEGGKLAARAAAVLTKPVKPDALEAAVRTQVERRLQIAAARAKAPTGQVPKPAAAASALRVLIVDDSRVIRGVVREALAEVGVTVMEAEDGAEALLAFAQARPDAVISDLQMPGVDGARLIPLLRERSGGAKVPIVVLSAMEDEGSRRAALAAGADAYLVKSIIDGPALLRALKAAGLPLG